jgi:hypothetical protein
VLARIDALVLRATQLLGELVDGDVEGGELVAVDGFGTHHGAFAGERQLDRGILHAAVVVGAMRDLDVEPLRTRKQMLDAEGLLIDHTPESIRDAHSHADDAGFHPCLLVPVLPAKGGPSVAYV